MVDEKGGGGGAVSDGGGGETSRNSTLVERFGERQRLTVELRPEETTIVSWKKLIKEAKKVNESNSSSVAALIPPANVNPALESCIAPGQPGEAELEEPPASHRFNAVIEKIERLYMGKDSSDEEDLDDIPDDDQYDTEDSFIDDAELDEYFEVDNSAIKHDGFFINKGILERINEPTSVPNQQPKKRRRNDLPKVNAESDDGHLPRKHVKVGLMAAGKSASLEGKNISDPSRRVPEKDKYHESVHYENQQITFKKKSADKKTTMDHSMIKKESNGDASHDEAEKQKTFAAHSRTIYNKSEDIVGHPSSRIHSDRSYSSNSQSERHFNSMDHPDRNVSGAESSLFVPQKLSYIHRKDGSVNKPKVSTLEKAIRELAKIVAESRPSPMEIQDADPSSLAVKRRIPLEIKQKLAKVARASNGNLSVELMNRLMSILGHLMQLRTLKRNLKAMFNNGLSAKQENDDRFRQLKNEVTEMVKMRVASKEFEQQAGASDDFQEKISEGVPKRKHNLDHALEDKICELYDIYVDGLDEDVGPQIRKLYAKLAELWPNGSMDNHGIKRAICRAKDRKKALHSQQKDQEKIMRKKMFLTKPSDTAQPKTTTLGHTEFMREKTATDSSTHNLTSLTPPGSNTAVPSRIPSSSTSAPSPDKEKHEKVTRVSSSNPLDETRNVDGLLAKKKMKKKPEDLGATKSNQQSVPLPSFEELT